VLIGVTVQLAEPAHKAQKWCSTFSSKFCLRHHQPPDRSGGPQCRCWWPLPRPRRGGGSNDEPLGIPCFLPLLWDWLLLFSWWPGSTGNPRNSLICHNWFYIPRHIQESVSGSIARMVSPNVCGHAQKRYFLSANSSKLTHSGDCPSNLHLQRQ
jgi:hypothetical protein